jgi:hypothetical protein
MTDETTSESPPAVEAPTTPPAAAVKSSRRRARSRAKAAPARKATAGTRARGASAAGSALAAQRGRTTRNFPASTFTDALTLAHAIWQHAEGERVRRLTLFDALGKSPESGPSRQLVTNSGKYGITSGSYAAEYVELTTKGRLATNPEASERDRVRARFDLAIADVPVFKLLYDNYVGKKLPSQAVIRDFLREHDTPDDQIQEAIDTFTLNAKSLGLLRVIAGAERLISVEQLVEEKAGARFREEVETGDATVQSVSADMPRSPASTGDSHGGIDWSKACFYVTPIGSPGSEQRMHSDLFLSALVEPAVTQFGLTVIRADQIGKAGLITAQVIEHLVKARLVVADLSFHNPNVFYELALRHAKRLPVVQLIRTADPIPFDLEQFRTIQIDTTSIYTLVPQLETYRAEIASHIRRAMSDGSDVENPLTAFYPTFWD